MIAARRTYYLNVCADVIEVPEVCAQLKMTEPAPAYQVTATGRCHYLGSSSLPPAGSVRMGWLVQAH